MRGRNGIRRAADESSDILNGTTMDGDAKRNGTATQSQIEGREEEMPIDERKKMKMKHTNDKQKFLKKHTHI
jgi:hypothetical protein